MKVRGTRIPLLVAMCAVALTAAACSSSGTAGTASGSSSSSGAHVVIGNIGAFSGALGSNEGGVPDAAAALEGLHRVQRRLIQPLFHREARVVPSLGYCADEHGAREMDDAAAMLAADPEIVRTIITHRFPLEDATEAFRVAADRAAGAIKVVLEP